MAFKKSETGNLILIDLNLLLINPSNVIVIGLTTDFPRFVDSSPQIRRVSLTQGIRRVTLYQISCE